MAALAEPPRDVTDEDEDLIGSGRAVELLEVWQGLFRGDRLVKAGMLAPHVLLVLPAPCSSSPVGEGLGRAS